MRETLISVFKCSIVLISIVEGMESNKIRVCWMDCGRSSGKESYVSKRNVLEKDNIAEGNTISVKWGKTNKYYKAEVLGNSQETLSKEMPKQPHLKETAKEHQRYRKDVDFQQIYSHLNWERELSMSGLKKSLRVPVYLQQFQCSLLHPVSALMTR